MRATLQTALNSNIPKVLNMCADDARVVTYINEAIERIVRSGTFWGTYQKYHFCASGNCITLPRQVAAVLSIAVCNQPVKLRNEWFEFLENGWGLREETCGDWQAFNRAESVGVCSFEDMARNGSEKIKVYAGGEETPGARILLRGYDQSGNWIRTQDTDGSWVDGEYVNINFVPPSNFVLSTKFFSALTNVIKPVTNQSVRLFKYNPATAVHTAMAIYESDEEFPNYRRILVPGLGGTGGATGGCATQSVTLMVKMEFMPVRNPNDFLLIGNIPAIKLAVMSIAKQEAGLYPESEILMEGRIDRDGKRYGGAIQLLEAELAHHLGPNIIQPVNFESRETWGAAVAGVI